MIANPDPLASPADCPAHLPSLPATAGKATAFGLTVCKGVHPTRTVALPSSGLRASCLGEAGSSQPRLGGSLQGHGHRACLQGFSANRPQNLSRSPSTVSAFRERVCCLCPAAFLPAGGSWVQHGSLSSTQGKSARMPSNRAARPDPAPALPASLPPCLTQPLHVICNGISFKRTLVLKKLACTWRTGCLCKPSAPRVSVFGVRKS